MSKVIEMEVVTFKRTMDSPIEFGIMFGRDKLIVDADNEPVSVPVWNWQRAHRFSLSLEVPSNG